MTTEKSPTGQSGEAEQYEKTPVQVFTTSQKACQTLAAEVASLIRQRSKEGRGVVLGLATGSTPVPFYRELIRLHREEGLSLANVTTFNLDEYYGIGREHRESYYRFMHEQLFDHVDIPEEQIHIPPGDISREDVFDRCREYERAIDEAGGIDLQILGIGRTGHIGFNEPGSSQDSRTRLITLDRVTRRDAARDFLGEENVPHFAITMGVGTILKARRIVLMAWGDNKASIVAQAVEGPVTDAISASFLQTHTNACFYVDQAAASALTRFRHPWLVRQADWNERQIRHAVIWLTQKIGKPVLKLQEEDYNENGLSELLIEHGPAYSLNIRIFNEIQHTITGWPGGKPNADDTNRPERATPHPKRVLVFSPEPQDDVICMAGTLNRLVGQGHEVTVVYMTSGSLGVPDAEAVKFLKILQMTALRGGEHWKQQSAYAEELLRLLEEKGRFGSDPEPVRQLKSLIRRGEAREAAAVCGLAADKLVFLDMPFYEQGRYRQFRLTDEDTARVKTVLQECKPHQIYATGNLADPSSLQYLSHRALQNALATLSKEAWLSDCYGWHFRGVDKELEPHEIDMAVPLSPGELALKINAIKQHQSQNSQMPQSVTANQTVAALYDKFGMAEYEAIECFQRWLLSS